MSNQPDGNTGAAKGAKGGAGKSSSSGSGGARRPPKTPHAAIPPAVASAAKSKPRNRAEYAAAYMPIYMKDLEVREPEGHEPDITGGWEATTAKILMRLNRAGGHIEGWMTNYNVNHDQEKVIWSLWGDLEGGIFKLHHYKDEKKTIISLGDLHIISKDEVEFFPNNQELPGPPNFRLKRTSSHPGVSDNTLLAFPEKTREQIKQEERSWLSQADREKVMKAVSNQGIGDLIDKYYKGPTDDNNGTKSHREVQVRDIDKRVGDAFIQLIDEDRRKAKPWALVQLRHDRHETPKGERTLLTCLQEMVAVTTADKIPNLVNYLGIRPSGKLYHYEVKLEIMGFSVEMPHPKNPVSETIEKLEHLVKEPKKFFKPAFGVGLYEGKLTIEERESEEEHAPIVNEWTSKVVLGKLGWGLELSAGATKEGKLTTPYHYTQADLNGTVKLVDVSIGVWKASGDLATHLSIGSSGGAFPDMSVDCGGWGNIKGFEAGMGLYIGHVVGGPDATVESYEVPNETRCDEHVKVLSSVSFAFGRALMRKDGRELLRILAAQELALFRSGEGTITVVSHADRPATPQYNMFLSQARSISTFQALMDILGNRLLVNEQYLIGYGEQEATEAKAPNVPMQKWRRSDIFLNGRLTLTLAAEGPTPEAAEPKPAPRPAAGHH